MKMYWGKGVQDGVVFGKIFVYERGQAQVLQNKVQDSVGEVERFMQAVFKTVNELQNLCSKAKIHVGEENAAIFEMQKLIATDELLIEGVKQYILNNSCNAEYALTEVANDYISQLVHLEDETMKAKAMDCQDVSRRMLEQLSGMEQDKPAISKPVILLAEDLTPSETLNLDKENILAIVLKEGSAYSHTAILARSMGIPCLVQTEGFSFDDVRDKEAAVDGKEGCLYIEPTELEFGKLQEKQLRFQRSQRELQALLGVENRTIDGKTIQVFANIESPKDLNKVLESDAGGIGLFRTEFLFLARDMYPEEEEQYQAYKEVVEGMKGKKVVIRTLDIGADKVLPYLQLPQEKNPAMGLRGIRLCFSNKQMFLTQLKALLRASAHGNMDIMLPMISAAWEIFEVKKFMEKARRILDEEGKRYGVPGLGIMIETPAAALMAGELAEQVDFFSIGTNDLMQYTLAVDRMNATMGAYVDPYHPALYKMIKMVVNEGHKAGIPVGICGELAADKQMTPFFLEIGMDELSMPASEILSIRKRICSMDCSKEKGRDE